MEIDNSRAQAFRLCPWFYYESYLRNGKGVQPIPVKGEKYGPLELGGRVHELLEEKYRYKYHEQSGHMDAIKSWGHNQRVPKYDASENEELENEAQWMLSSYLEHYPADNWEIIDVEKTFRVALPERCSIDGDQMMYRDDGENDWHCATCKRIVTSHIYIGKIDLFIHDLDDGRYWIIDHKTEKRGSKSHIPQKLAVSDQGSLYLWAARRLYPQVDGMKYNILTRPSTAGREGPSFPERYQIERSEHEIDVAVRDITIIADHICDYTARFHDGEWPANREECYGWGYCDYYQLHRYGEDPQLALQHKFQPREEYLNVEGVDVIV